MNILISNDDGYDSAGIQALARAMRTLGEVTVVAPHRQRSTAGHSLTLHKPLRVIEVGEGWYATTGTPADCIYLGIRHILKKKPDLVVSGINAGANLGTDVFYSGTVAAAREAALMGVRSFAFSLVDSPHVAAKIVEEPLRFDDAAKRVEEPLRFDDAAKSAVDVVEKLKGVSLSKFVYVNVNIPNVAYSDVKGIRVARQGVRFYANDVATRRDPRGREYHWIGGSYVGFEPDPDCDCAALETNYVSVTPLSMDCTQNENYTTLRKFLS